MRVSLRERVDPPRWTSTRLAPVFATAATTASPISGARSFSVHRQSVWQEHCIQIRMHMSRTCSCSCANASDLSGCHLASYDVGCQHPAIANETVRVGPIGNVRRIRCAGCAGAVRESEALAVTWVTLPGHLAVRNAHKLGLSSTASHKDPPESPSDRTQIGRSGSDSQGGARESIMKPPEVLSSKPPIQLHQLISLGHDLSHKLRCVHFKHLKVLTGHL